MKPSAAFFDERAITCSEFEQAQSEFDAMMRGSKWWIVRWFLNAFYPIRKWNVYRARDHRYIWTLYERSAKRANARALKHDAGIYVLREDESPPRNFVLEEYERDINEGLEWNKSNPLIPSIYAVVDITYKKVVKGKERWEEHSLGVVRKNEVMDFQLELSREIGRQLPKSITAYNIKAWIPYINWRKMKHIIDDKDIREKYGLVTVESAVTAIKRL